MSKHRKIGLSAFLLVAAMVFAVFASAADDAPNHYNSSFDELSGTVRIASKYANGFNMTTTGDNKSTVRKIKGNELSKSDTEAVFEKFDYDYAANKVVEPTAKSKFVGTSASDNDCMMKKETYDNLISHIGKTGDDTERWYAFNLKDNTDGIKFIVSNLEYYNGKSRQTETIHAKISITGWTKSTGDGRDSGLVDDFSFDSDNTRAKTDMENSISKSYWKLNGSKYYYDRPDEDPYLFFSVTNGGLPGIRIARLKNIDYKVEFFTDAECTSPKSLSANISAADIDTGQWFQVGSDVIDNVDAYATDRNTHFKEYGSDNQWNGNTLVFKDDEKSGGQYYDRENDGKDALAIYVDNVKQYSARYTSGHDGGGGYSYFYQSSVAMNWVEANAPEKQVKDNDSDGDDETYDKTNKDRPNRNWSEDTPAEKYTKAKSLTYNQLKGLKDANAAQKFATRTTFRISHTVASADQYVFGGSNPTTFTAYKLIDEIDPAFEVLSVSVAKSDADFFKSADENGDIPLSACVTQASPTSPSRVEVEAKDSVLTNRSFYGTDHVLAIAVKIKDSGEVFKELDESGKGVLNIDDYLNTDKDTIVIPNTGKVYIDDRGPDFNESINSDKSKFTQITETTFTSKHMPKPKKRKPNKNVADGDDRALKADRSGTVTGTPETFNPDVAGATRTEDTLDNPLDAYTYYVGNTIPTGYIPKWYYSSYKIVDTVPDILNIVEGSASVQAYKWTQNDDETVTYTRVADPPQSAFDISISGKTITASANSAILKNKTFYAHRRYVLTFKVKIDTDKYSFDNATELQKYLDNELSRSPSRAFTWKNNARVEIDDAAYNYGNDEDNAKWGQTTWGKARS